MINLEPEQFIDGILVRRLGVRYLVVGDDFCFGRGRRGDFAMLQQAGERHGFEVVSTQSFCVAQQQVSSTRVREALRANRLSEVHAMLGGTLCRQRTRGPRAEARADHRLSDSRPMECTSVKNTSAATGLVFAANAELARHLDGVDRVPARRWPGQSPWPWSFALAAGTKKNRWH